MNGPGQLPAGRTLDDMLSLDEAAAWLRMHPRTLLLKTKGRKPKVPALWISPRIVRFHPRTVLAALVKQD